jgi:DNA-binding transcriptional MerR regulator
MSLAERPYLSIGEVLGLLLEEFPDVTISKIRFLESQGLIDPERTPSGYRKFYETDVERLRVILREQRENFLPLKVIRDRLESGVIDDTGPTTVARGIRNVVIESSSTPTAGIPRPVVPASPVAVPAAVASPVAAPPVAATPVPAVAAVQVTDVARTESLTAEELCVTAGVTPEELASLEAYGLIAKASGPSAEYRPADVDIAVAAAGFLHRGVEARHLRAWKHAAERESGLFEQLVLPLLRQRNPQARQQALATLSELTALGAGLRAALVHAELKHHLD